MNDVGERNSFSVLVAIAQPAYVRHATDRSPRNFVGSSRRTDDALRRRAVRPSVHYVTKLNWGLLLRRLDALPRNRPTITRSFAAIEIPRRELHPRARINGRLIGNGASGQALLVGFVHTNTYRENELRAIERPARREIAFGRARIANSSIPIGDRLPRGGRPPTGVVRSPAESIVAEARVEIARSTGRARAVESAVDRRVASKSIERIGRIHHARVDATRASRSPSFRGFSARSVTTRDLPMIVFKKLTSRDCFHFAHLPPILPINVDLDTHRRLPKDEGCCLPRPISLFPSSSGTTVNTA